MKYNKFNGESFFTVSMSELKRGRRSRQWQLVLAPLRRLTGRLTLINSATSILATLGTTSLAIHAYV